MLLDQVDKHYLASYRMLFWMCPLLQHPPHFFKSLTVSCRHAVMQGYSRNNEKQPTTLDCMIIWPAAEIPAGLEHRIFGIKTQHLTTQSHRLGTDPTSTIHTHIHTYIHTYIYTYVKHEKPPTTFDFVTTCHPAKNLRLKDQLDNTSGVRILIT